MTKMLITLDFNRH